MIEPKIRCSYHAIVDPNVLKEHPNNNNKHTKKQIERLAKIIKYNGWTSVITVSRISGYITKGHARLLAAKKLKCKKVPIQYIDYESPEHEYADLTADNEIARWATLDLDKVKEDVINLNENFDIELLGIEKFTVEEEINLEKNNEEISDEIEYLIIIICKDELEQADLFDEFNQREIKCKIMS